MKCQYFEERIVVIVRQNYENMFMGCQNCEEIGSLKLKKMSLLEDGR